MRFDDLQLRDSCTNFLRFTFPGTVRITAHGLQLEFHTGTLAPNATAAVVERLLWAWRTARDIEHEEDGVVQTMDDHSVTAEPGPSRG